MIISILLYVDPGSGSYLIQVIIAAIFGAWFWLRNYWRKFKSFFTKAKPDKEKEEPSSPDINTNS
jgi:hypothetical protein